MQPGAVTWRFSLYFPIIHLFFLRDQGNKPWWYVSARCTATHSKDVLLTTLLQQSGEQTGTAWGGTITLFTLFTHLLFYKASVVVEHKDGDVVGTFNLIVFRIKKDCRSDVMVQLQLLHRFESNKIQSRVVKLFDCVHLISLHHYLFFTINLHRNKMFKWQ